MLLISRISSAVSSILLKTYTVHVFDYLKTNIICQIKRSARWQPIQTTYKNLFYFLTYKEQYYRQSVYTTIHQSSFSLVTSAEEKKIYEK